VERPFTEGDAREIADAAEWVFEGANFVPGEAYPDGSRPDLILVKWSAWIREAVLFMDGDGATRHWKYAGAYADQPEYDQAVYEAVRRKWVKLVSEERRRKP